MAISSEPLLFHTQFLFPGAKSRLPATYSRWVYCLLLTPVLLCPAFLCMQAVDSLRDGTSLVIAPTVLSGQVMKYIRGTLAEFRGSLRSPRRSQLCYYARLAQVPSFPILARAPQSPATSLFYSPVRSLVLRYFLVPDSATAPASPLRLKAAAEGRGSPQPPRSLPSGSHTVFR